jgi:hypothetical protein
MSDSGNRKKTKIIMVRATPEEHEKIKEKASDLGLSVPAFLRACSLSKKTRSRTDAHVLNELRRLGGLQKLLFNEGGGALSKEYAGILIEIKTAISRIGAE